MLLVIKQIANKQTANKQMENKQNVWQANYKQANCKQTNCKQANFRRRKTPVKSIGGATLLLVDKELASQLAVIVIASRTEASNQPY